MQRPCWRIVANAATSTAELIGMIFARFSHQMLDRYASTLHCDLGQLQDPALKRPFDESGVLKIKMKRLKSQRRASYATSHIQYRDRLYVFPRSREGRFLAQINNIWTIELLILAL